MERASAAGAAEQLLLIDTSLGGVALASVQLTATSCSFAAQYLCTQQRAAERVLATQTAALLANRGVSRVVVAIGPGSFTAIRIGIAFACGLVATPQALLGISSLQAMAGWLAAERGGAYRLYLAISADSGVVAHAADGVVQLSPLTLPAKPGDDDAQVLICGAWPRLAAQLGGTQLSGEELLTYALRGLAWQVPRTAVAQSWPLPLYLKEPYGQR